jgi:hypothetical protein
MVLYSLGKTTTKSKRHDEYLAWAMEVTGKSKAEVSAAGREVKKRIKALAVDQPGDGPIHVWDIGAEEAVSAVGALLKWQQRRFPLLRKEESHLKNSHLVWISLTLGRQFVRLVPNLTKGWQQKQNALVGDFRQKRLDNLR